MIKDTIQESIWAMQTAHDVSGINMTNSINRMQATLNNLGQVPDLILIIKELASIAGKYENRDVLLDAKKVIELFGETA